MPVYDPTQSYPLILKTCPDKTTAPVVTYPGPCPPPPWTNSAWYFPFPPGYSFCYYCAPGQLWHGHPDCNCCASITGGGSDEEKLFRIHLVGSMTHPEIPQSPEVFIPEGYEEPPASGAAPPPPKPGNICSLYNSVDIWWQYIQDDAGNVSTTPIADCYPATNPNQGCPVMPGQCFFWDEETAQPTCVVERLLDYPTGNTQLIRNLYYCSTCADPVAGPWSPNGFADHETSVVPVSNPPPDPWPVTSNPTQALCTDCKQLWNGNFHCLHPDDPMYNNPSTCIQLSANTVVYMYGTTPNITYYAINAPNYYQLAGITIQGTLATCELNCIGGCFEQFSGTTSACNYNPQAAFDDGSCCFSFPCTACGDATAINYCSSCCTIDNTLCLYPGEGCMDDTVGVNTDITGGTSCGPLANQPCEYCNYDPLAYISTTCCNVSGCMDGTCNTTGGGYPSLTGFYDCGPSNNLPYLYSNYDPNACCAGQCCMDPGCMDLLALNFDPSACISCNGCCIYPSWDCVDCPSNCNCVDPMDGSGTHSTLTACNNNCPPPTWDCVGQGTPGNLTYSCVDPGNGTGQYSSLSACQSACPPDSWDCVGQGTPGNLTYSCVDPGNGTGQYSSLSACQSACPPDSWDCVGGTNCQDPGTGYGQYSSLAACNANCPIDSWDCSGAPNWICSDPGTGLAQYSTLSSCQNDCYAPSWNCLGPGNCVDPGNGSGTYSTLAACNAACPPLSWNCIPCTMITPGTDGHCIDPGDGTGTYSLLNNCLDNCPLPPVSWDCVNPGTSSNCYDPGCGQGQYNTLSACQNSCITPMPVSSGACGCNF
jgi:hypothetical protein